MKKFIATLATLIVLALLGVLGINLFKNTGPREKVKTDGNKQKISCLKRQQRRWE